MKAARLIVFALSFVLLSQLVCLAAVPAVVASHGTVERDDQGIAHITAGNEYDLFYLNGWVHAQDRLFQMDMGRRTASGTLAELLGPASLGGDTLFRQLGLRRAAQLSLQALSPRAQVALQAYADGVNAWVAANPLPPEYTALHITHLCAVVCA
jgi:penicillin amidase